MAELGGEYRIQRRQPKTSQPRHVRREMNDLRIRLRAFSSEQDNIYPTLF